MKQASSGFTLVEISIVMIIIGLLIGGTFGGMRLIDNANAQRVAKDLKQIESAALTFKDTYGRIPGDLVNPGARLPNCTVAPCSNGGNGNRRLDDVASWNEALSATNEKFTFWSHLLAADLISLGIKNTTDTTFGEGQPAAPISGGYRMVTFNGVLFMAGSHTYQGSSIYVNAADTVAFTGTTTNDLDVPCFSLQIVDTKIDDGLPYSGIAQSWNCSSSYTPTGPYTDGRTGAMFYDARGF